MNNLYIYHGIEHTNVFKLNKELWFDILYNVKSPIISKNKLLNIINIYSRESDRNSDDTGDNVCQDLQNWCYNFLGNVTLTDNFQYHH